MWVKPRVPPSLRFLLVGALPICLQTRYGPNKRGVHILLQEFAPAMALVQMNSPRTPFSLGRCLDRSGAVLPILFWWGGFPYQNRLQKKGTLIPTSLLEDLDNFCPPPPPCPAISQISCRARGGGGGGEAFPGGVPAAGHCSHSHCALQKGPGCSSEPTVQYQLFNSWGNRLRCSLYFRTRRFPFLAGRCLARGPKIPSAQRGHEQPRGQKRLMLPATQGNGGGPLIQACHEYGT